MTPTGGDPAYTLTVNTGDLSGDVEPACNCSELASQINAKNSELTVTCLYGFLVETSESTTAPLVTSLPGCNVLDTADPTERCRYVPGPGWCTVDDYWKVADWSVSGLYDDSTAWVPGGVPAIDEEIASELAGIVSGSIPETGLTDPCLCDAYRQPFWTNEATLVRVRTLATTAAPTDVPTGVPTVSTTPAPSSAAPTFATAAAAVPYTMYMCQLGDPTVAYGVCSSDATANAGTVYCGNNVGFPSCAWNIPCTGGHIIGTGDVDTTTMGCGTADNTPVLRSNYVDLTDVECFDENGVCPTTGTGYAVCWNTATQTPLMSYCNPTETSRGDQCTATYPCDGVNELLFRDRGGVWPWPELIGGLRYGSACGWGSGSSPPTSSAPTSAAPTVASPTVSLSPTAPPGLRLWDSPDAQSRDFWPAKETTASFLWQYGGIGPLLFADVRDGLLVSLLSAGDALDVNLTQALRPGDACSGVSGCGSVAGRVTVPFATADENDLITDDDTVGYTNYSVSVCRWIWVSFSYGSGDFAPVIVLNIPGTSSVDTLPALFGAAFVNTGYLDRVVGTPAWTTTLGKIRAVNASVAESIVTRVWWTPWVNVSADNDTDTCGGVAGAGLVPTLDYYPSFDDYRASLDDWCGLVLNSTTSALSAFVGDGPRLFPRLYIDSTLAGTEPLAVTFTTGSAEQLDDWVVSLYSLALTGGSNGVRTDNRTSGAVLVTPPGLVVNTSGASYAPLVWFSVSSEPENASAACTSYNGHVAGCNDVPIEDCATVPLCAPRTATTTPSTTTSAGFYTATLPPTRPPSPGPAFVEIDQGAMLATVGVAVVIVCLLLLLSAVLVCHSRLNGREVPDDEHTLLGMDDT